MSEHDDPHGCTQRHPARPGPEQRNESMAEIHEMPDRGHGDGLTTRQRRVLEVIRNSVDRRGYPPSLREIGEAVGLTSPSSVSHQLSALERKGYLRREDMKSRALRIVKNGSGELLDHRPQAANDDDLVDVRILGRVAAGLPLLAEENVIDTVRIDRMMLRGDREVFGLRVTGDSMIEAGILNGDYIFVRKQSQADRGEIVVALIGDEATVKHYYPERDYIRFQPANSQMAPILVRASDFKQTMLLGVVIGVFRRL